MIRRLIVPLLPLLTALAVAPPARAGTVEVTVRDADGEALEHRYLAIRPLPFAGQATGSRYGRRGRWHQTDVAGKVTFERVDAGAHAIDVAVSGTESYVRPSDNPFAPAPRVTLLNFDDHLTLDVVLWRGVRVTVGIELPDDASGGFRAVFRHPGSGLVRTSGFPRGRTSTDRVLPPGIWDVTVEPKPGYLLVALDRDRVSLPGHDARLDLLHEPAATFLTWTYTTPAAIEGSAVTDTGQVAPFEIVATLTEPGPWHPAVAERGGSIFDRVTTAPHPITGNYRMVVPDGRWRVQPEAPTLLASEPEAVDLTLAPGQTGRADFSVRMGRGKEQRWFVVEVENERGYSLREAIVEVARAARQRNTDDVADLSEPLRSGVTDNHGSVRLDGLDAGNYRVIAGHVDYLEGRLELPEYDPEGAPEVRGSYTVVLPDGAEIRLRARDPADEPLAGVELTVERVGEDPDTELRSADVAGAKRVRTAVTDQSGRALVRGFYPGTYRARGALQGERGTRGLIHLGLEGHPGGGQTIEFEIGATTEEIKLEGRMLPAASLSASLLCSDGWDLPDTVAVHVFSAYDADGREILPQEIDADNIVEGDPGITFTAAGMMLAGRLRDGLTLGPFEQGVYYLALKPQDFDRWTWAFETHDAAEASKLQIDVTSSGPAPGGAAFGDVDLGLFAVECAPAVDLLPAVAGAGPADFPDVREVTVEARFFDLDANQPDKPATRRLSITRRDGRIRLRGCPAGRLRLDFTLNHPHLLPEPALSWQVEVELERGWYRQIVPEIKALGGAVVIAGGRGSATLLGPNGLRRQASFEEGEDAITFPSLVPGRYRVEVSDNGDEPIRVWRDLEVRAGETLRLDANS